MGRRSYFIDVATGELLTLLLIIGGAIMLSNQDAFGWLLLTLGLLKHLFDSNR